jgi:hypothetical protein
VNISDATALEIAGLLFGDDNKKRPTVAFQMFIYDMLASGDPSLRGKTLVNSVYQPAKFFTEGVLNVPVCGTFYKELEQRLHGLLGEMNDIETGWRRTSDVNICGQCDFKRICGR